MAPDEGHPSLESPSHQPSPEARAKTSGPYFLFIDSVERSEAMARLKSSRTLYRRRSLDSSARNWTDIASQLQDSAIIAVAARFTRSHLRSMRADEHEFDVDLTSNQPILARLSMEDLARLHAARKLLPALARQKHIIFVHESIMFPEIVEDEQALSLEPDRYGWDVEERHAYFGDPDPCNAEAIRWLANEYNLNFAPYGTNAELAVLASTFVEANERDLLFRLYVPAGQLFSGETSRLLTLFHDWLTRVKGKRVRQAGYRTGHGEVYEFFGDGPEATIAMAEELDTFASFLDTCVADPESAIRALEKMRVDARDIHGIVSRYAKEARRVQLDVKHSYEERRLSIRHRLESELADVPGAPLVVSDAQLDRFLDAYMPPWTGDQLAARAALTPSLLTTNGSMVFNLQINSHVTGDIHQKILQDLTGVQLSAQAEDLLRLVKAHGGDETPNLQSALYELEDEDGQTSDRTIARAKIRAFLNRVGSHLETTAYTLLQKYLDQKLGL